jgi:hypothetical protein
MSAAAEELAKAMSTAVQDHVAAGGKAKDFERVAMIAGFRFLIDRIEKLESMLLDQVSMAKRFNNTDDCVKW